MPPFNSPEQKAVTATAPDDIWTPEQMGKFLDHVAAHRLGGCFALTPLGLRREEVGGLRWSDIDLDAGALRIRQARVDVNGCDTIVATKTERSARGLPLPLHELAMVKAMRTFHLRERLAVGRPLADDDLLLSRGRRDTVAGARLFAGVRRAAQAACPKLQPASPSLNVASWKLHPAAWRATGCSLRRGLALSLRAGPPCGDRARTKPSTCLGLGSTSMPARSRC